METALVMHFIIVVSLTSSSGSIKSLCDTADEYWEVQEGKQDITFICTGLAAQDTVSWYQTDPSFNGGTLFLGSCPSFPAGGSQPVCDRRSEAFKPSRISYDTSVLVVNTTAAFPAVFMKERLSCSSQVSLTDIPVVAGCRLDYIYSDEKISCDVQFRNDTWTTFGMCVIKKSQSWKKRYRCEWFQTKQSPRESVLIANVSMSVVPLYENYVNGSCNFTSHLPSIGSYTYRVNVVPGEVKINATFISNNEIRFPASQPYHNCPEYVAKDGSLNCTCFVSDLGSPPGILRWNFTNSTQLSLAVVQTGTHICQLLWNNTFVKSVEYIVNVAYGPNNVEAVVLSPQPFETNGSQEIRLNCSVSGYNPPVNVTWVRSRDQSVICNSPLCVFTPKPPGDDGLQLECQARNPFTKRTNSSSVTITLNYPPTSLPVITANPDFPDTQPVYEGDNITLRCTVNGGKPVNATVITFTCPNKIDMVDSSLNSSSMTSSLTFLPVSSYNHGRCTCNAKWRKFDLYNDSVTWNMNVYTPPSAPIIFQIPDTTGGALYPFMAGSSGTLGCQSNQTGRPEATYSWPVAASGLPSRSNLTFYSLSREDNGKTLKCRANNSYTNNRQPVNDATFVLQVYYEPLISFKPFSDGIRCAEVSSVQTHCIVAEGQKVHIKCTADSNPGPVSFHWRNPSKYVYSNASELVIPSTNHTVHNGDYNCTVITKQVDTDSRLPLMSSAILTVVVGYSPSVLAFSINNMEAMSVNIPDKSRVDMKCLCSSRPIPSIRLINAADPEQFLNQSLPTGDIFVDEQTRELLFTIDQVPCEASGFYRCDANNSFGQDSQSRILLVSCAPRNTFSDGQPLILSATNGRGELRVRMTAYPTPVMRFLTYLEVNETSSGHPVKENIILVEYSSSFMAPAAVICSISVINVTQKEEGFYRIVFSNSFGELSFTFFVKQVILDDDDQTKPDGNVVAVAVLAVLFSVLLVLLVVVVIWVWRRGWTLPCYDVSNQRITQQNQSGDPPGEDLSPVTTNNSLTKEGGVTSLYDSLQMEDVGKRSQYEEVQQYQNPSTIPPSGVESDTKKNVRNEHTYVN